MIEPRIIPRNIIDGGALRVAKSTSARYTCKHTIKLGGKRYRCGREVNWDGEHSGIHDAFVEHSDGGAIRW